MSYDTEAIRQANDIRDHAARYTTLRRESHSEMSGPCPKCGGHDRFHCKAGMFFCRQCYDLGNGKPHDIFGFYEWLKGWDFLTTCKALDGKTLPEPKRKAQPEPKRSPGIPDDDDLQAQVMQIAVDCAALLWEPEGKKALAWLRDRGLQDDTLKTHLVGFCSLSDWTPDPDKPWQTGGKLHNLFVWRGVTVPHWQESTNTISGIKVRLGTNGPGKYRSVAGSRPSLYLADYLAGHDVGVICEGELDTLLLHQEAGDLVGVCGLGSADNKNAAIDAGLPFLLPIKRLLVATDSDDDGEGAALAILERTRRARRLHVPIGNDITDFWKAGGDLRAWVESALAEFAPQQESDPVVAWAVEHLGSEVTAVEPVGLGGEQLKMDTGRMVGAMTTIPLPNGDELSF